MTTIQPLIYFQKIPKKVPVSYTHLDVYKRQPLYCHEFTSPVDEILQVIEEDRDLSTAAAIDYLRTAGSVSYTHLKYPYRRGP